MAAGLTVAAGGIQAFADWLDTRLSDDVLSAGARTSLSLDLLLAPGGLTCDLIDLLESAGPYGMGWPAPRVAIGPVRRVQADVVGGDHVRLIVAGADGSRIKAMAFRAAETDWGQALLHAAPERRLWLAGRARVDEWNGRRQPELHLDDAAFAD